MAFQLYNVMTCGGFSTDVFGGCSMAWLALALLFFIIVFSKKWLIDSFGMEWSNIGSFVGGYGLAIIIVTLTGAYKFELVGGLVGAFLGGIFGGNIFGDSGSGGYY